MIRKLLFLGSLFLAVSSNQALAASSDQNSAADSTICHDGLIQNDGYDLNDEFGNGTTDITRCLEIHNKPKVVMQVNLSCRDSFVDGSGNVKNNAVNCADNRAYALGNMRNMIKDYELSHGIGNWEIVAVVHSGGWGLLVEDGYEFTNILGEGGPQSGLKTLSNQFQGQVEDLIDQGVQFLFCQNTTRGMIKRGNLPTVTESTYGDGATEALIDGVGYVTAGVTAIAEFQALGYSYVQP